MPEGLKWFKLRHSLSRKLAEAVELYNRFRSPEARAEILKVEGDKTYVKVEGSFCETCGINDWVEDFVYTLEDVGVEAELEDIIESEDPGASWRIGVVRIKGLKR